jgi:type IV pilus biogenesis/stability protein PilW
MKQKKIKPPIQKKSIRKSHPYLKYGFPSVIIVVILVILFYFIQVSKENQHQLKILLIGIDGAEWEIIQPLVDQGKLPTFKKLIEQGVHGNLKTIEPILSPVVWTSIATGKTPDKHGITFFTVDDSQTHKPIPITSRNRTAKPIWKILGENGIKSGSVGWWATWPAESTNGTLVTDRIVFHAFRAQERSRVDTGLTYPPKFIEEIRGLIRSPESVDWKEIQEYFPKAENEFLKIHLNPIDYNDPLSHFLQAYTMMDSYKNIILELLRKKQYDFLTVYFEGVDTISHLFMRYESPRLKDVSEADFEKYHNVVNQFYIHQDAIIGELLKTIDKQTMVMIVSDHGFKTGTNRPVESNLNLETASKWHALNGVFIASGGPILNNKVIENATVLDITPTILALMHLPIADDMDGKVLTQLADNSFWQKYPIQHVKSYEGIVSPKNLTAETANEQASNEEMLEKLRSLGYINNAPNTPNDSAERHNNLGVIYFKKGKIVEAVAEYQKAVQMNPNYAQAQLNLGNCYYQLNQLQLAIPPLEIAIRLMPKNPDPYASLGKVYQKLGQIDKAMPFYQKAIELKPTHYETLNNLGVLYMQMGVYYEAIKRFNLMIELYPKQRATYLNLALCYENKGDSINAETTLQNALQKFPDDTNILGRLTLLYNQSGQYQKAEKVLQKLTEKRPNDPEVWYRLSTMQVQLRKLNPAIENLRKAINLGGNIWKIKAKSDPLFEPLYSNPSFVSLTK